MNAGHDDSSVIEAGSDEGDRRWWDRSIDSNPLHAHGFGRGEPKALSCLDAGRSKESGIDALRAATTRGQGRAKGVQEMMGAKGDRTSRGVDWHQGGWLPLPAAAAPTVAPFQPASQPAVCAGCCCSLVPECG